MKRLIFLLFLTCFSMFECYSQEAIYMPKGSLIQSLRNDGKSEINIPGCEYDGLKMDDINNLYGNYWRFYLIGTVDGLADITEKPYCQSVKIALRKGCGYVACHSESSGDIYVRIYVTEMVTNKAGEIIGATLLYQKNYQSEWEIKKYEQEKAEREAAKIFWNGNSVTDVNLRKVLLENFDSDNDGKISQAEASKQTSLTIEGGNSMSFYESGIGNLTGLTSLTLNNTSIKGSIILAMPNLQKFVLKKNQSTLSTLDLTGCVKIETVVVGASFIDKMILKNCATLKNLDFNLGYYTVINENFDISGCTSLTNINGDLCGKFANLSGCSALENCSIEFSEINLFNCSNLNYIRGYKAPKGYELRKLNLEKCYKLQSIDLQASGCELCELNLSDCIDLESLSLRIPKLSVLDLSNCRKLGSFRMDSTSVKTLDLSGMKHLQDFNCYNSKLKTLNLSGCDSLWVINCNDNELEAINLTGCRSLKELFCQRNVLTLLDISDCDSLMYLCCYRNATLSKLDVTNNRKLLWVQCANTAIQELDISHSETTEWAFSEPGEPIRVPGATQGFKTLWVNEKQKIEMYTSDGSIFKPLIDKDLNKDMLLSSIWVESAQEYKKTSTEDLNFKIRVRNNK